MRFWANNEISKAPPLFKEMRGALELYPNILASISKYYIEIVVEMSFC